jgi:hypothetical protein
VFLHDPVGDRQPQTGAAASFRKERLEDLRKVLFQNAGA